MGCDGLTSNADAESSMQGYESDLVDLAEVALADLPSLEHPALRRSLHHVLQQADDRQDACAGFQSAL
jgi:FXSXX-COOH protein